MYQIIDHRKPLIIQDRVVREIAVITALDLIEDVLDTIIELGNGVDEQDVHNEASKLFALRYFLNACFMRNSYYDNNPDKKYWDQFIG